MSRRNLILSTVGDSSVHRSWLAAERSYDVMLVYFGGGAGFPQDADHYLARKGLKWELVGHVLDTMRDLIDRYDVIWLPDDDVVASPPDIERLFGLFREHKLQLAQPAIASGEISFGFMRPRPGVILRYTPYVEVMCPMFTRRALWRCSSVFIESQSGWGIDLVWPRLFDPNEIAIIDAVGVEHARPLGTGALYKSLASNRVDPRSEMAAIIERYGRFDEKQHRKLLFNKIKLPAVRDPRAPVPAWRRAVEALGIRRAVA